MDHEIEAQIGKLEAFRGELRKWRDSDQMDQDRDEHRTHVNRNKRAVKKIMVDAECHHNVWVRVPEEDGFEDVSVDPFDFLFDSHNSREVITSVVDMVDETIGELLHKAALLDAFMADDQTGATVPKAPAAYYGGADLVDTSAMSSDLTVAVQQGRLELVDPPPESPMKLNRLRDELPGKLAVLTTALAELTEAVKRDNGFLGDLLKTQLVSMLKATVVELEAPHTDAGRLKATARVLTGIAAEAAKKGGADFIKGKLEAVSTALGEVVKWLWHQGGQ